MRRATERTPLDSWLYPASGDRVLHVRPDGPLASPAAARDAIRALSPEERAAKPIRVLVGAGTYFLEEPFLLGPEDAGSPGAPIVYQAEPGTRPLLSGGRRLTGLVERVVDGLRQWTLCLDDVREGRWWFTRLYVDGQPARRARRPREGLFELSGIGGDPACREAEFGPGELAAGEDLEDVELVALGFWVDSHMAVESVDGASRRVRFRHPPARMLNDERRVGRCRYFAENVRAALGEPGEWHLHRRSGTLTYLPRPEERLETTTLIAPRLPTLIVLRGTPSAAARALDFSNPGHRCAGPDFPPDRPGMRGWSAALSDAPVHDVHVIGLELCHTEWHYPAGDPGPAQAAYTVPAAVRMAHCHDCSLRLNRLRNLGGYGIELETGARQSSLVGNLLEDLGGGGIKLGHGSHFNTVSDNRIHRGGRRFQSAIGIWVGHSGDNRILHNAIDDFFYTGISVGWIWGYRPSMARRNRIERNRVTRIGQGLLSDMGGIYTLGVSPGTVVRGNLFRGVRCFGYGGSGLYPDEGSGYILYENNVVAETDSGNIHMNYGRDCIFRNNLLLDARDVQVGWGTPRQFRPMRLEGNLIVYREGETVQGNWFAAPSLAEFAHNIWFRRDGRPVGFAGHDWEAWRERGFDKDGLCADPLLIETEGGLPVLRADSPALPHGFRPLDPARTGPRASVLASGEAEEEEPPLGAVAWAQIDSAEPLPEGARYEDRFIRYPESAPCALRLRTVVENAGDAPFEGTVDLRIDATEGGTVEAADGEGARSEFLRLEPGGRAILPLTLAVGDGVRDVVVSARSHAPGFGETVLGLGFRPTLRVPSLRPGIPAARIETALREKNAAPEEIRYGKHRIATFLLGVSGEDLALFADVNDDPIRLCDPVYKGSMIDLFGISDAGKSLTGQVAEQFGQLFLVPGSETAPARLTDVTVGTFAGGDVHFALRPGGYRVAARIPLSALKIEVRDGEFAFKAAVYAHVPGVPGTLRAHLFNERARTDPHAYGRMRVE